MILILFLIAPNWGLATIFSPNVNLKDLGAIKVVISDMATGGCWTNIKEVKDYADGKLEIAGAGIFLFSDYSMQMQHPSNMNNQILDTVKEAIAEWEVRN